MAQHDRALKLRCRDGHFEMAEFEIGRQPDGYWMWVSCDFEGHQGGHWLSPDGDERVLVTSSPYVWTSAVAAFQARDRWEVQQEG